MSRFLEVTSWSLAWAAPEFFSEGFGLKNCMEITRVLQIQEGRQVEDFKAERKELMVFSLHCFSSYGQTPW